MRNCSKGNHEMFLCNFVVCLPLLHLWRIFGMSSKKVSTAIFTSTRCWTTTLKLTSNLPLENWWKVKDGAGFFLRKTQLTYQFSRFVSHFGAVKSHSHSPRKIKALGSSQTWTCPPPFAHWAIRWRVLAEFWKNFLVLSIYELCTDTYLIYIYILHKCTIYIMFLYVYMFCQGQNVKWVEWTWF